MAEAGTGFFHPWSQDKFLDQRGMEDSSGICFAVAAIWIEQQFLAARGGGGGWENFKGYFHPESGRKTAAKLQDEHNEALESMAAEKDVKKIVIAKLVPALTYLKKSGLGQKGACVTDSLTTITDFVTAELGFYFIAAHGKDGGHAFAVHHKGPPLRSITFFDPNYGKVTWNSELYYRKEFLSFFSSVRSLVYEGELSGSTVVLRIGKL